MQWYIRNISFSTFSSAQRLLTFLPWDTLPASNLVISTLLIEPSKLPFFFFFNINSTFFWDAHREKSSFVLLEIENIYSDPRESTPGWGSWWSRAFARVGEERLRWRTWPWRRRTGRRKQTGKNRTPIPSRSLLGYFRNNGQQRELSRQRGIANSKVQVLVLQRDGFRTWEKVSSQSSSVVRSWGFMKVPGQRPWRKRSQRERGRGCQGTWM